MSYAFRVNVRDALGYIETRQNFIASNLSGGYSRSVGKLPSTWCEKLYEDVNNDSNLYVVLSYDTPIAWYSHEGGWTVPRVKYSVTTSKHQNIVRNAVVTFTDSTEV